MAYNQSKGIIRNTTQPCFSAHASSNTAAATGDGTVFTAIFDTKDFDQGGNFASNTFTAPVTGKYYFCACMYISGVISIHTAYIWQLVATGATLNFNFGNSFTQASASGLLITTGSAIISMTAGDTAQMKLTVLNGTKVISYSGGTLAQNPSYFMGYLIC